MKDAGRSQRLLMHPILFHPRSRSVFVLFLLFTGLAAILLGREFQSTLSAAGISELDLMQEPVSLLSWMLPTYMIVICVVVGALIGAAVTAARIVYPARRVEQWLALAEAGADLKPMRVRRGDLYEDLINGINELYGKLRKKSGGLR